MNRNLVKSLGMLGIFTLLSACVSTGGAQSGNLQQVVNTNSQAIQQIQGQLSGIQPAQADSWSQLQAVMQELALIRGELDNLKNSTAGLGGIAELGNVVAKHDAALRLLESQLALDFKLDSAQAPYNSNRGQVTPPTIPTPQNQEQAQTLQPVVTPPAVQTAEPTNTNTAQALYDSGINNFNQRDYTAALKAFVDFTKVYPNHNLVSNAWFWQGESHYQLKNYAAAALAYQNVIKSFPNSIKAPASYLKQGMSFIALNRIEAAKEVLNYLVTNYPKATEAKRAEQVLADM